jgi:hypothetical protein
MKPLGLLRAQADWIVNGRSRRNLVVPARSGKGPLTILFADLRHRAGKTGGLPSSPPTPW